MTARSYVEHMARLRGVDAVAGLEVLERLALAPGPDVPIATLSKGNSQKVALAQALGAPVGLLLLDEPTSGLDPRAREVLQDLLAERRAAGAAILVTTHALVAGTALEHCLTLVRRNTKDFDWIAGLPILDPFSRGKSA